MSDAPARDTAATDDGDGPVAVGGGRRRSRLLVAVVLALAWVVVLFTLVFPRLERVLNDDPTLDTEVDAPVTEQE